MSPGSLGTRPEGRTVGTTCAPAPPHRAGPPARPAEPARTACAGEPPACERRWEVAGGAWIRALKLRAAATSQQRPAHLQAGCAGDTPHTAPRAGRRSWNKEPLPGAGVRALLGSGPEWASVRARRPAAARAGPSRNAPGGSLPLRTLCASLLPSASEPKQDLGFPPAEHTFLRVVSYTGKSFLSQIYMQETGSEQKAQHLV